jgi:hypothetical protein
MAFGERMNRVEEISYRKVGWGHARNPFLVFGPDGSACGDCRLGDGIEEACGGFTETRRTVFGWMGGGMRNATSRRLEEE